MMAVARTVWPTALLLAATALTAAAPALAQQQVKSNVLFILADNTGYR
jgi:hypothetical protein